MGNTAAMCRYAGNIEGGNRLNEEKKLNIYEKLLKTCEAAGVLQRTKQGYGYKYVPEEDIQAKVTGAMIQYGLMIYPKLVPGTFQVTPYQYQKWDKNTKAMKTEYEIIVSAEMVYTWVDVDTGDKIEIPWAMCGQMADVSQAFGAGLTYSNRYFLMKTLQLATSESDPDRYRSMQAETQSFDDEKAKAELKKEISELTKLGSSLISKKKLTKERLYSIVAKHNGGDQNPNSISDIHVVREIIEELKKGEPKNAE